MIYFVDARPEHAARALDDVRLRAAVLYSAQVLCDRVRDCRGLVHLWPHLYPRAFGRNAWASVPSHSRWLFEYLGSAIGEYVFRSGRRHGAETVISYLHEAYTTELWSPAGQVKAPPAAGNGVDFGQVAGPMGHRLLLVYAWRYPAPGARVPTWRRRGSPAWREPAEAQLFDVFERLHGRPIG